MHDHLPGPDQQVWNHIILVVNLVKPPRRSVLRIRRLLVAVLPEGGLAVLSVHPPAGLHRQLRHAVRAHRRVPLAVVDPPQLLEELHRGHPHLRHLLLDLRPGVFGVVQAQLPGYLRHIPLEVGPLRALRIQIPHGGLVDEIEHVPTNTARFAVPAPRRHGVLKTGTTLPAVPRAAAHALRVISTALLPAVLVERWMGEHQI